MAQIPTNINIIEPRLISRFPKSYPKSMFLSSITDLEIDLLNIITNIPIAIPAVPISIFFI